MSTHVVGASHVYCWWAPTVAVWTPADPPREQLASCWSTIWPLSLVLYPSHFHSPRLVSMYHHLIRPMRCIPLNVWRRSRHAPADNCHLVQAALNWPQPRLINSSLLSLLMPCSNEFGLQLEQWNATMQSNNTMQCYSAFQQCNATMRCNNAKQQCNSTMQCNNAKQQSNATKQCNATMQTPAACTHWKQAAEYQKGNYVVDLLKVCYIRLHIWG